MQVQTVQTKAIRRASIHTIQKIYQHMLIFASLQCDFIWINSQNRDTSILMSLLSIIKYYLRPVKLIILYYTVLKKTKKQFFVELIKTSILQFQNILIKYCIKKYCRKY